MERLTTNKDTSEMSMVELAHNSCYEKKREARYRDYGMDIDARKLAIKLLDEFVNIPNKITCDEDFDSFIADAMQYGVYNILGLIAIFYRNIWAMSDLRERLNEYEDLGITPNQIKELDKQYTEKCSQIKEIVKRLKKEAEDARAGGNPEITGSYIRAIHIIKEIAEGWPELTDDKLVDLAIKKMEQRKREAK